MTDIDGASLADRIEADTPELARELTDRHFAADPELDARYGSAGRAKCLEDAQYHLKYMVQAIRARQPELFEDYVRWARAMLQARGVPPEDLRLNLERLRDLLRERLPARETELCFEAAWRVLGEDDSPRSFIDPARPHGSLARDYLDALLEGSRAEGSRLILEAADAGVPIRDLYLDVFRIAQYELGRLWQLNRITVAQEHFCTAATQLIMSQLYPRLFDRPPNGLRLLCAAIGGELHEIGARMVADLFELEGWDTHYLGANVPAGALADDVAARKPDLVALSVTMTYHLPQAIASIAALRERKETRRVKILVGGYPFRVAPELWREIGADGFASEADEALRIGLELVR